MTTTPSERSVNASGPRRSVGSVRHRRGFWVVAFAFLAVMALGTFPRAAHAPTVSRDAGGPRRREGSSQSLSFPQREREAFRGR
jgi:hypothetical protein